MKAYLIKAYCIMAVLLLGSCGPRPDRPFIRRIYYGGGHIRSEITYIHDSIKDGSANYYFGREHNYSLYMEEYFKNGKIDGIFKEYYPNGLVKMVGMYNYGVPMGPFYFYDTTGRLTGYNASDCKDRVYYAVFYDAPGHVTQTEGRSISKNTGNPEPAKIYSTKDTVQLLFSIAEAPHTRNNTVIGVWGTSTPADSLIQPFAAYPVSRSCIAYKKTFGAQGHYRVMAVSALFDSVSGHTLTDTAAADIIVADK